MFYPPTPLKGGFLCFVNYLTLNIKMDENTNIEKFGSKYYGLKMIWYLMT